MITVNEVYDCIDKIAPFENAQEWDNSGIIVKSSSRYVSKIAIVLDATCDVIKRAAADGCELIISHHPIIFEPIKTLDFTNPAELALSLGVSVICAHTNLDLSEYGADALFSKKLEEKIAFTPLYIAEEVKTSPEVMGFGRIGELCEPISFDELARAVREILGADSLRAVKETEQIKTLSFCCGGGAGLLEQQNVLCTDAFITSDVKHSGFITAKNKLISLIVPTHYQMEKPAMAGLGNYIKECFPEITVECGKYETEVSHSI